MRINNYEEKCNKDLLIAHISDIHYSKFFSKRLLRRIINEFRKTKPDYICITGDLIDHLGVTENMSGLTNFLGELSKISKVLIGLGNHDIRSHHKIVDNKWYEKLDSNLIVLNNSSYEDDNIYFYGLTLDEDYYKKEKKNTSILASEISKIKVSNKYNILLFHSPINLEKEEVTKVNNFDLVLVGHAHNGLTPHIFPGNFGIIAPCNSFYVKNARNSFKSGKSKVIISGGITKLALSTYIFHLFNWMYPSEINYIHLKEDKKS